MNRAGTRCPRAPKVARFVSIGASATWGRSYRESDASGLEDDDEARRKPKKEQPRMTARPQADLAHGVKSSGEVSEATVGAEPGRRKPGSVQGVAHYYGESRPRCQNF